MNAKLDDIGKLILRLAMGGMMLPHGIHGVMGGIDGVKKATVDAGLPELIAYGVYMGEFVAPILILLGFCTRVGGLLLAGNMLGTFYIAHSHELLKLNDYGALSLELNYLFFGGGLAILFLGGGRWSLRPARFAKLS